MSRTVLITGASSGIGAALVREWARRGARLVLVARRAEAMRALAADCGLDAARLRILACDITDFAAWQAQARALLDDWGCPDTVVANAGISVGALVEDAADLPVFDEVMRTNWLATIATLQPFVAPMRARGHGTLAAIASVAAVRGLPGHGAYSASKAAVVRTLESLRVELRGSGVKVVTIAPGYVATPLTARNPFSMPFLMQPADFARACCDAVDAGRAYRTIPWQMAWVARLLHVLPRPLYDLALAGRQRKPRRAAAPPPGHG
jgi:short-subunit dehydrogenase